MFKLSFWQPHSKDYLYQHLLLGLAFYTFKNSKRKVNTWHICEHLFTMSLQVALMWFSFKWKKRKETQQKAARHKLLVGCLAIIDGSDFCFYPICTNYHVLKSQSLLCKQYSKFFLFCRSSVKRCHIATSVVSHRYGGLSFPMAFPTDTADNVGAEIRQSP